jgi:hypothetical protein
MVDFGRVEAQIFTDFQAHAVDFFEITSCRHPVILWAGLNLPQLFDLLVEVPYPFERSL